MQVKKIHTFTGHSGSVYALAQGTRPGMVLSGSSDHFLAQWNLDTLEPDTFSAKFPGMVYAICPVYSLNLLLIGTSAGGLHIIDLQKKEEVKFLQFHTAAIFDIKVSLKHKLIFTCGADGKLNIFHLENLKQVQSFSISHFKLRHVALSEDKNELCIADGSGHIHVLGLPELLIKKGFLAHQHSCNVVLYHPNKKYLLSGGRDAHLKIWDRDNNFELLRSIPAHNYAVYDIRYLPSVGLFASASRDKTVKLWDPELNFLLRLNKETYEGHVNSVNKIWWEDELQLLVSAGDDRSLMVWRIEKD